jgi:hypothetical protein
VQIDDLEVQVLATASLEEMIERQVMCDGSRCAVWVQLKVKERLWELLWRLSVCYDGA